jgi:hypothetical protein
VMEGAKTKRRWFRFSLRSLLVVWTLAAVAVGWYVHRQRIIQAERAKLVGSWNLNGRSDAMTCVMMSMQLTDGDFEVGVPDGGVGVIDFRGFGGHSKGIYRIDGDSLTMVLNDDGEARPTTFADAKWFWEARRVPSASDPSQTETN